MGIDSTPHEYPYGPGPDDKHKAAVERMREASGEVNGDNRLAAFLYLLTRDHLPVGVVETLLLQTEGEHGYVFTNGWLAQWAEDAAGRLVGN